MTGLKCVKTKTVRFAFCATLPALLATSCGKQHSPALQPATPDQTQQMFQTLLDEDLTVFQGFVAQGIDLDTPTSNGMTPLSGAAAIGNKKSVSFLISHGCNAQAADTRGMTPLHYAALYGRTNVISLLVRSGAQINARDFSGLTPLHCAATGDAPIPTSKLLLQQGADPRLKDSFGANPAGMAELNEKPHVAALIRLYQ